MEKPRLPFEEEKGTKKQPPKELEEIFERNELSVKRALEKAGNPRPVKEVDPRSASPTIETNPDCQHCPGNGCRYCIKRKSH